MRESKSVSVATLLLFVDGTLIASDDTFRSDATSSDYAFEAAYAVLNGENDPSFSTEMHAALTALAMPWPSPEDEDDCPATLPSEGVSRVRRVA